MLSSGVIKGASAEGTSRLEIVDPARRVDPDNIWTGFRLRFVDASGRTTYETTVARFDRRRGALLLATPCEKDPAVGQAYELFCDAEAPLVAIRYLLGLPLAEPVPAVAVRLGTTRGTNALITRRGAKTALVTTRGFGDILTIGYQNRPRLFDLAIRKPPPLFAAVIEIDERTDAEGNVLQAPDRARVRRQLAELKQQGIESLAICLLHGFVRADHEELLAEIAREVGFDEVSVSSRIAPLVKIVSRGDTTVMDAYLNPLLRRYVRGLRDELKGSSLRILTSAGGLVDAEQFVGKDSILSGPAGGVVGFSRVAQAAGFQRAIGFDMGGTSTDVSRFDGRYELEFETEKSGVRVVAPMMAIETVAAGGGSICRFDGVKLVVGPDSAGADPGPACYGRGGPLTITDVNFLFGKILPERFPFPLDRAAAEARLAELIDEIERATARRYAPLELADGLARVANANMAKAIGSISVAKGCDPRDYVLVPFGGAAGQHACAVARELGIPRILHHPHAGLLSAYGIGLADVERHRVAGLYQTLCPAVLADAEPVFQRLEQEALEGVLAEGIARQRITVSRWLELRYRGLEASLSVLCPAVDSMRHGVEDTAHTRRSLRCRASQAIWLRARRSRAGNRRPAGRRPRTIVAAARILTPSRPSASNQFSQYRRVFRLPAFADASFRALPTAAWQSHSRAGHRLRVRLHDRHRPGLGSRGSQPRRAAGRRNGKPRTGSVGRHDRRPGDARNLQQSVRGHRRTDGHYAAQHLQQRQREGAARLQLRPVHAHRRPGGQRSAHSGPPGRDGRNRAPDHRRQSADSRQATSS